MPALALIANPNAGRNREAALARFERLAKLVRPVGRLYQTANLDELKATLGKLLDDGVQYVVCDGGDGSLHWAINLALEHLNGDSQRLPMFSPTRGGTIDFVASKLGFHGSPDDVLRRLVRELQRGRLRELSLDTLRVTGIDAQGQARSRVGFAVAAGGIGQRFFERYFEQRVRGRRAIAKILGGALGARLGERAGLDVGPQLARYGELFRPTRARVAVDGRELPILEHSALNAGSIEVNFRGLMRVFAEARRPGVLHFQAGSLTMDEILKNLPLLVSGGRINGQSLLDAAGTEMEITALDEEGLSPIVDGEPLGQCQRVLICKGPSLRMPLLRNLLVSTLYPQAGLKPRSAAPARA